MLGHFPLLVFLMVRRLSWTPWQCCLSSAPLQCSAQLAHNPHSELARVKARPLDLILSDLHLRAGRTQNQIHAHEQSSTHLVLATIALLFLLQGLLLKDLEHQKSELVQQLQQLQGQLQQLTTPTQPSSGAEDASADAAGDVAGPGPASSSTSATAGIGRKGSSSVRRTPRLATGAVEDGSGGPLSHRSRTARLRQQQQQGLSGSGSGADGDSSSSNLLRHALVWSSGAAGAVVAAAVVAVAHGRARR